LDDVTKPNDAPFDGGNAQVAKQTDSPVAFPIGLRWKTSIEWAVQKGQPF
jgi:hypothetical protein